MSTLRVLGALSCLLFSAVGVEADTYQILFGRLGEQELTGQLESGRLHFHESGMTIIVDDFAFAAGDRSLDAAPPVVFEGLTPVPYVVPANQVGVLDPILERDGEGLRYAVDQVWLRAGGEIESALPDGVFFHFVDFRAVPGDAGHAVDRVGDPALGLVPRRLHLEGTVVAVEQPFEIRRVPCGSPVIFPQPAPPGSSGDVTLINGGVIDEGDFEVHPSSSGIAVIAPAEVPLPFCQGLYPLDRDEETIGRFLLVATLARPIEIELRRSGANPGSSQGIWVSILGSADLDVRDVDEGSLRFGPGDAAPAGGGARRHDVDRDGDLDLTARFTARDAGIDSDDAVMCLSAQTRDGEVLDGCAALRAAVP